MFLDVHFVHTRGSWSPSFPADVKLQFLSLVEVALIPLHLAAGPSLDVWTHNEKTEKWLSESLLDDWRIKEDENIESAGPWWLRPIQQSDSGILLRVEDRMRNTAGLERKPTEVLIYAALSKEAKSQALIPTPPGSSSPNAGQDGGISNGIIQDIRIYALPLCSTNSAPVDDIKGLASPPWYDKSSHVEACFLNPSLPHPACTSTSPRKRQRISTMFEDAAYQRKRLMKHGGDRISKAMAAVNGAVFTNEKFTGLNLRQVKDATRTEQTKDNFRDEPPRAVLSCSSNISSLREVESSRPQSRRGPLVNSKRSSLDRVEGIASVGETSRVLESSTIEQQNKSALTKIVMTGMRIYGFQQRKKSMKPRVDPEMKESPFRERSRPEEEEDDYKLIYHQTFKAASFAFRTHMSLKIINQEVLRDVVDSLLVIFCNNPLASHTTVDTFCAEGGKDDTAVLNAYNRASAGIALPSATDVSCVSLNGHEKKFTQTGEGSKYELVSALATTGL